MDLASCIHCGEEIDACDVVAVLPDLRGCDYEVCRRCICVSCSIIYPDTLPLDMPGREEYLSSIGYGLPS